MPKQIDDIPFNSNDVLFSSRQYEGPIPDYWTKIYFNNRKYWGSHHEHNVRSWIQKNIGGLWAIYDYDSLDTENNKSHYTRRKIKHVVIAFENPDDKLMFELMGGMNEMEDK